METEQMIQLIQAVAASGLTEFEYCENDVKLTLKAEPKVVIAEPGMMAETRVVKQTEMTDAPSIDDSHWVKSPLVGTFYSAPQEGAEPYVKVGDKVTKGQTLGIIETMKLMNELESDCDGVVAEIAIENEQVVEFGQMLFRIE